jgi:hypothetical protein
VTVHDEADAEDPVENGVDARRCGERGAGERDERRGEQALKRPVVRAMCARRRRERGGVVHRALVYSCMGGMLARPTNGGNRIGRTTAGDVEGVGGLGCFGAGGEKGLCEGGTAAGERPFGTTGEECHPRW